MISVRSKQFFVTFVFFGFLLYAQDNQKQGDTISNPNNKSSTASSFSENQQNQDSIIKVTTPEKQSETNQQEYSDIDIVHGGDFVKNEAKYPQASIFINDGTQVQFRHDDVDVWCDFALYYKEKNTIKATGNVHLVQGDTVNMTSRYIEYNGNTRKAIAKNEVVLTTTKATLTTDTLHYDRPKQQAYYDSGGTLRDSSNTLVSQIGTYYLDKRKVEFHKSVKMTNKDMVISSEFLYYFPSTKHIYFYGPTTGTGEKYKTYSERGFYSTKSKQGYFLKNSKIDYEAQTVYGDSIYYDDLKKYASITNHVRVLDTVNKSTLKGHYAEVYQNKDSIIVTKIPIVSRLQKKDSLFIRSDTLTVTGKEKNREIKMYHKVRIFGPKMNGRCDSIYSSEKDGITKLLKDPVVWYTNNQITGDQIHLTFNPETKKLDSLKVLENTFIITKDSIHNDSYNQIKGKNLFGKVVEGTLSTIDIIKNCEVIYYIYDQKDALVGINKANSDAIKVIFKDKKINKLSLITNPSGDIFPEFDLPRNARKLKNFKWRGDEQIKTKDELFTEEDKKFQLPNIEGIDNFDVDLREAEYNKAYKIKEALQRQKLQDSLQSLPPNEQTSELPDESLKDPQESTTEPTDKILEEDKQENPLDTIPKVNVPKTMTYSKNYLRRKKRLDKKQNRFERKIDKIDKIISPYEKIKEEISKRSDSISDPDRYISEEEKILDLADKVFIKQKTKKNKSTLKKKTRLQRKLRALREKIELFELKYNNSLRDSHNPQKRILPVLPDSKEKIPTPFEEKIIDTEIKDINPLEAPVEISSEEIAKQLNSDKPIPQKPRTLPRKEPE